MNWQWLAPAMLEFFYSQATPNDYFIGALSGPGYLYPRAVPPAALPGLLDEAQRLMEKLDLEVFDIMDYSEGRFFEGKLDLPRGIVEAYYARMPHALGFVNGYIPAGTFAAQGGRPFVSFDYYLSPTQSEEDAAADIRELAAANPRRPYFLLMHVRNFSDIRRVKRILDRLPEEFEVTPLDLFLLMAGRKPTFRERYLAEEGDSSAFASRGG